MWGSDEGCCTPMMDRFPLDLTPENWSRKNVRILGKEGGRNGEEETHTGGDNQQARGGGGGDCRGQYRDRR